MSVFALAAWKKLILYLPLLAYVLFAGVVALASFQGFHKLENLIESEKLHDLGAIADMKTGQIVSWQKGHKRRVSAFSGGALLAAEFDQWLQGGKPSDGQEQKLLRALAGFQLAHGYASASLLDRQGAVRITTGKAGEQDEADVKLGLEAMNHGQPLFSDIRRSSGENQAIHLSLAAPLVDSNAKNPQVVGILLLQIDPREFLYPLIQMWPRESASAETLLTRLEGTEVVFINELRHRKGTALNLRFPAATSNLPTAMAARGAVSTKDGVDYRGVPVVAVMRSVPGTSWYMVSKVDRDEIFAPIKQLKQWAASLGLAFAVLGGFFFYVWLQGVHARQKQLKAEHDAALEREMRARHFEHLTRYANDMIIIADEAGQIIEANEATQKALGYSREELLRRHVVDLLAPWDGLASLDKFTILKKEGALRMEELYRRKDGSTFPVEISARLIKLLDVQYIQGIVRDITERKQLEAVRAETEHAGRLNVAGEMASGMAHELSQPLTACHNYLDACLRGMGENEWDRERLRSAVVLAFKQNERAGRIVSHLKGRVREKGHEHAPLDVNLLVRDVMSLLDNEIRRQRISVALALQPLPPIMACRIEIEQVLLNLCKNAIEAMLALPQRELRVSTRVLESGDVLVAVSDTGMGIMPDEQAKLFDPFHTTKKNGLGLGLAICRSIVENHGGRIWVDAKRELGAEFCFTLPAMRAGG